MATIPPFLRGHTIAGFRHSAKKKHSPPKAMLHTNQPHFSAALKAPAPLSQYRQCIHGNHGPDHEKLQQH
jgi:hypothetical protein